ncbi:MAG: hypothetical protein AAGA37_19860 [Actinomycetota bacterium]
MGEPETSQDPPRDYRGIWSGNTGWVRFDDFGWKFWPDRCIDHFGPGKHAYIFSGSEPDGPARHGIISMAYGVSDE